MQVKIFSKIISPKVSFMSKPKEPLDCGLEQEINEWLAKMPNIKIHKLEQSMCGSGSILAHAKLFVTVLYDD